MGRSDARVVRLERAAGIGACGDRPCLRCTLAGEPFGDVEAARKLCNGGSHGFNLVEALRRLDDGDRGRGCGESH